MSENKEVKFDDIEKGSVIYEIDRTAIKRMVVTSDRIATDSVDPKYPDATFETSYQILHHISDIKDAPVITPGPDTNCARCDKYETCEVITCDTKDGLTDSLRNAIAKKCGEWEPLAPEEAIK